MYKRGHVAPKFSAHSHKTFTPNTKFQKRIKAVQDSRRIGGTAAKSATKGNSLCQDDIHAALKTRFTLEEPGCPQGKILVQGSDT